MLIIRSEDFVTRNKHIIYFLKGEPCRFFLSVGYFLIWKWTLSLVLVVLKNYENHNLFLKDDLWVLCKVLMSISESNRIASLIRQMRFLNSCFSSLHKRAAFHQNQGNSWAELFVNLYRDPSNHRTSKEKTSLAVKNEETLRQLISCVVNPRRCLHI